MKATLALLALLLTGCASGAALKAFPETARDQVAHLTVVPPSALGFCCATPLLIDDRVVAILRVRQYATVEIPAGAHVTAIPKGYAFNSVAFTAAPSEHVYILMDVRMYETDPRIYPASLAPALVKGLTR